MTNDGRIRAPLTLAFVIRHSSFVIRHSSFVIRHSSFVIRHLHGTHHFTDDKPLAAARDVAELSLQPHEVHRARFIREIETRLQPMDRGFLLVVGEMGRGKSVAMSQLVRAWRRDGRDPVCYFLPKTGINPRTPDEIALHLYQQLCLKHAFTEPAEWRERFANSPANRLEEFLRVLSPHLGRTGRREWLVVEATDQAVLEPGDDLIPSILRDPPERVVWLVSSRPRTRPAIGGTARIETVEFLSLVDERKDARQLLEDRGAALSPPLPGRLIDAICKSRGPAPVMFTLDWSFRHLEKPRPGDEALRVRESLRQKPDLWLREPRLLVYEDLLWVLHEAEKAGVSPVAARQWLLLPAIAGENLSADLLSELGLESPDADLIFRLAANFFEDYPSLTLRHPGYARAIRGEDIPDDLNVPSSAKGQLHVTAASIRNAHRRLAEACLGAWKKPEAGFALRQVCSHLRDARLRCGYAKWRMGRHDGTQRHCARDPRARTSLRADPRTR